MRSELTENADHARAARPRFEALLGRGAHAGDVAVKTLTASRDAVLQAAEEITRREGSTAVAEIIHSARTTVGVLEPSELPIGDCDDPPSRRRSPRSRN